MSTRLNVFPSGLYGITPEWHDTDKLFNAIAAACRGGMKILQWRRKNLDPNTSYTQALKAQAICQHYKTLFIINDDYKLALRIAADGVHLGKDDTAIERVIQARRDSNQDLLIGVSCYNNLALAKKFVTLADYLAFGALFNSQVKPDAVHASLDLFQQARKIKLQDRQLPLTLVGIGGITIDNAAQVKQAGADCVAVISGLFETSNIEDTAREFSAIFTE